MMLNPDRYDTFGHVPPMNGELLPEPLLREAVLLMAEGGADLFAITERLSIATLRAARLLAPWPWRYDLPENPPLDEAAAHHLVRVEGGRSGFVIRSPGDRMMLTALRASGPGWQTLDPRDYPGLQLRRVLGRLAAEGFVRRDNGRVALTARGEAAAVLLKMGEV